MQNNGLAESRVTEDKEREYAENVIHRLSDKADMNSRKEIQACLSFIFHNSQYWKYRIIPGISTKHFSTFTEFVKHGTPEGLDWTPTILKAFLLPGLEKIWEVVKPEIEDEIQEVNKHGGDNSNLIYKVDEYGTRRDYSIAVLKRDAPAIAKRVIAGEITAAEGMRRAGKKKPVITIQLTVEGFAKAINNKLTDEQRTELKTLI